MAELVTMELEFTDGSAQLCRTRFRHGLLLRDVPGGQVCAQRGRLGEGDKPTGIGQFQWTQAVKALAILMLRCAAWSMRAEQNAHAQPPQLSGKHETPASSLNWAISLGNDWLGGMFGTDEDGVSYVRQVIIRENADFKVVKTNPVVLSLNTRQLPVEKIKILRSGRPVDDPMEVDRLANEIERSWKSRPRVLPAQRTAAAPQPRPRVAVIAGPGEEAERGGTSGRVVFVKLDRDCKSYSVAELMELVETLQSALRESDVVPLGKREGCVEIGLRISAEEAEQFLWLVRSGALEEFGVIDGDLIPVENEAEFLTSLRALEIQAAIGCPLVLWTVAARRRLRQALAEAIGRRQPDAFATTMTDFTSRLRRLFPEARAIVVQDQYVGFRRREDEFILLVEIEGGHRPGRHLVKLASPERLAAELAAWESCRPYGLRHDLVFMTLEPGNADGPPDGLVYGDAQQFLGDVPAVYLETAFLGAVRHGNPSPAAVADTLVQLYERIGHLLYRQSFVDDPADADFVLKVPRLGESLPVWSQPESEPARVRQDVNTWASAEAGWFRDPVDYLQFVCRCVPWQGGVSPGDGSPVIPPPERWGDAPAVSELVPRMLRGCGHGDLHGRNVLVAIVRERARWPAVFDYEHMGPANLLAWDFVKMEVELKVRAYTALFAGRRADAFIRAVQEFEVELARQTEECQGGRSWPEVADRAPPHERLQTLLLTLRRQAALHLGIDAGRPSREWLDEYYFALTAYGVHAGRFPGLGRPNLLAGYVSAGVACARFLWTREDHLAGGRALSAEKPSSLAADMLRRPYPSYHKPLETARAWLRDGTHKNDALELLAGLRSRYAHVLAIGNELVLALLENDRPAEAIAELGGLDRQFQEVDEETRCRWGSLYKREGDRAWEAGDLVTAEGRFLQALEEYKRGYVLRQGHYPGINQATVLLLLAALARQRKEDTRSLNYLRRAEAVADDVLARRDHWSKDFTDDNVWHPATVGEAHLLKRNWREAASHYTAALGAANVQPFHRQSIGKQARCILEALALLDVRPEPPFDNPDALFGALP